MFELRGTVTKIVKNDYEDELVVFKVKRAETIYTCRYMGIFLWIQMTQSP